jgi:hypothetical protein
MSKERRKKKWAANSSNTVGELERWVQRSAFSVPHRQKKMSFKLHAKASSKTKNQKSKTAFSTWLFSLFAIEHCRTHRPALPVAHGTESHEQF